MLDGEGAEDFWRCIGFVEALNFMPTRSTHTERQQTLVPACFQLLNRVVKWRIGGLALPATKLVKSKGAFALAVALRKELLQNGSVNIHGVAMPEGLQLPFLNPSSQRLLMQLLVTKEPASVFDFVRAVAFD